MRITVLGNGSLGCVLAAHLSRGGHAVSVLARPERLRELGERPIRVSGLADFEAPVAWASAAEAPGGDLLIVVVKTFQTAAALAQLGARDYAATFSLQNGVGKNALLEDLFPGRVLGAATQVGGELVEAAHVRYVLAGTTWVGELDGRAGERAETVARTFTAAGLPTEARDDVRGVEWSKLCQYAGAALVAAASGASLHRIYQDEDLARLYLAVLREAADVARGAGIEPVDCPGFPIATLSRAALDAGLATTRERGLALERAGQTGVRSSLLQALDAGRPTELEDTAGWLLARAAEQRKTTPTLEALYRLVRARIAAGAD